MNTQMDVVVAEDVKNVETEGTLPETKAVKVFTQDEVNEIVKERLTSEKRKVEERMVVAKRQAEIEAAAKNGDWQKLAEQREKELQEAQLALKAKELAELRLKAARMAGLPEDLAVRLNGDTEDELTVDALALARSIPKPQAVISATNPGVPPRLTEQAIRGMTPDEINKNWAAVGAALANK